MDVNDILDSFLGSAIRYSNQLLWFDHYIVNKCYIKKKTPTWWPLMESSNHSVVEMICNFFTSIFFLLLYDHSDIQLLPIPLI